MQKIIVDMTPGHRMPTIYFSQGDVGTQFAIDLRSRFGNTLPASPTVTIQATKPSGFGFSVSATSLTNGVAIFTTTAEMTDEAGYFPAELKVVKDSVTLFTANFNMDGEATTHPAGTIDGQQEEVIPELTQLVERVETAASSVLDMTVEAETLAAGSQATYSYDEDTNTATFGIPQGEAGAGAAGVTANAYSSSATYAVGDYVIHNSNLYRCTTAITTAESFTAAHWTQVVLGDDVSDLKSDLNGNIQNVLNSEFVINSDLYNGTSYKDVFVSKHIQLGKAAYDSGKVVDSTSMDMTSLLVVEPEAKYYLSFGNGARAIPQRATFYDENQNVISSTYTFGTEVVGTYTLSYITTPANCRFMYVMFAKSNNYNYNNIRIQKQFDLWIPPYESVYDIKQARYEINDNALSDAGVGFLTEEMVNDVGRYVALEDSEYTADVDKKYDLQGNLITSDGYVAVSMNVVPFETYKFVGAYIGNTYERMIMFFDYMGRRVKYIADTEITNVGSVVVRIPAFVTTIKFSANKTYWDGNNVFKAEYNSIANKEYVSEQVSNSNLPKALQDAGDSYVRQIIANETDGNDSASFVFITDYHYPYQVNNWSMLLAQYMDKRHRFSMLLNGGDFINWYDSEAEAEKSMLDALSNFSYFDDRLLVSIGNHDHSWSLGGSMFTSKKLFRLMMTQNKHLVLNPNDSYVSGESYSVGLYGYADDEFNKMRYISLNYCDHDDLYNPGIGGFSQRQIEWMCDVLKEVGAKDDAADWGVVIMSHYLIIGSATPANTDEIFQLLATAKVGGTITVTGSSTKYPLSLTETFPNSVPIVCALCGHTHRDEMHEYHGIQLVNTTSDAPQEHDGTEGTISEMAYDVITVNKSSKTVKITRIGDGDDRDFTY